MQEVIHLPSQTRAKLVGSHFGMRATLVELHSGQQQYWKNDYIQILKETEMSTHKVLIRLSGPKGKSWQITEHIFETLKDASQYLQELTRFNEIKDMSKSEETASLTNGWSISANYSLKKILKAIKPKKPLDDFYPFDLRKSVPSLYVGGDVPLKKPEYASSKGSGKLIKLQDMVKEPRKARVILRGLVNKKKITKPARWGWAEGSPDFVIIQAALKGV